MDQILINLLNGVSSGLLLFMLSSGLTLIFSMMGVLNFAHASFYMVGAYAAYTLTPLIGFTASLIVSPLLVGGLGALFERTALRRVHKFGHVPELLITFGLSYVVGEVVALIWGRSPLTFDPPTWLQGPAFTIVQSAQSGLSLALGAAPAEVCNAVGAACSRFPLTRAFMAVVALGMLVSLWLLLTRTRIGLVIQAALTHPEMVEALGHNVPRVFMLVFGSGCALAGLAGVIGGVTFVTEPNMANIGPIIFAVIVIGGMGSLSGAFVGSLVVGLLQTLPLTVDANGVDMFRLIGVSIAPDSPAMALLRIKLSETAQILPYLALVLILILRPKGLLGTREG
ncbi:branched-chain amino acid ABC transporter permease [Ideonella sp. 4Y16]|uniref:Branched-chain amino acid ABC transporter permease n=1 Tax=Ideonella alba TaxID=2824118 RepID=A0A940YLE1_9BURK|nr:branched-chain amino acid ABC transporter permease [Ideonella alba]MBQ0931934.1 branched-chain amino acid ABC transporter permease [Ideonella alba]MBQ0942557.1 branched-chain amino acid ABC transporter permease [Ideonella alba]